MTTERLCVDPSGISSQRRFRPAAPCAAIARALRPETPRLGRVEATLAVSAGIGARPFAGGCERLAFCRLVVRLRLGEGRQRGGRIDDRKIGERGRGALAGQRDQACGGRRHIRGCSRVGINGRLAQGKDQKEDTSGSRQEHTEKAEDGGVPLISQRLPTLLYDFRFPSLCHSPPNARRRDLVPGLGPVTSDTVKAG